jgi:acid phosphatase
MKRLLLSSAQTVLLLTFSGPPFLTAQNGVPRPDHVVIVIEENKAFDAIIGSANAPYINSLAEQGALFISSFALTHPSQPNYLGLFSGSTHGIGDDSCPHHLSGPNLASELFDAGFAFAGYSESMPAPGYRGCDTGNYARKHNPWVNFDNVPASANLTLAEFPANFAELPTVSIVVPNLDNDMHDGSIARGDAWLRDHLDSYVQWAKANNSLFLLTWDEDSHGMGNHIVTLMVGQMVRPGRYAERINHYNTLRTLLEMYGLPAIASSAGADAITSSWTPESANSPISLAITNPADGITLVAPVTIRLTAEAVSAGSEIGRVEFFDRGTRLGEATKSPFTLTWANVPIGDHWLVAKTTDALGRQKTSTSVEVRVINRNPFPTVKGTYSGLFYEPNQAEEQSSGFITLTIGNFGSYSARLIMEGKTYGLNGVFESSTGDSTNFLSRPATNPLAVALTLDLTNGTERVTGTVSEVAAGSNVWTVPLVADRAVFNAKTNPAPQAGKYTMIFPIDTNAPSGPTGDGFGTVTVSAAGAVSFRGTLADGTKVTQKTGLSKDGNWPLFASLYKGKGSLLSWVTFTNETDSDFNGRFNWFKQTQTARYYPGGFTNEAVLIGSHFVAPTATNEVLKITSGVVAFTNGNLVAGFTNLVVLDAKGKVMNEGTNRMTLSISKSSGTFSGSVTPLGGGKAISFKGALLQKQNVGSGFFLGTNESGRVSLRQE